MGLFCCKHDYTDIKKIQIPISEITNKEIEVKVCKLCNKVHTKTVHIIGCSDKGMQRAFIDMFSNDLKEQKPNMLVFGALGRGKKNKIIPFTEFKYKYIPSSWISIERYINEEGKEMVVFWYNL